MKHLSIITALAVAGTTPLHAAAQTDSSAQENLEETVVTSSRIATPLRQIGTSVSVITQEEITALGFNSLPDILRTQPSIGVTNNGGAGKATSVRVRGEEGYRTKVLLDGIDISDTSTPQTTPRTEYLLSEGIGRVEILRGPQGLMYGADAGGVVNISTIAPQQGLGGSVSAEGGRYGSQEFAGNVRGGNDTVDYSLSAADYETDGFNSRSTDTDLNDDDGYENTTLHARLGWNVSEDLRLSLVARDVDGNTEYDGCFTATTFANSNDCRDEFEQKAWRVAADYETGRFTHNVAYSDSDSTRDSYTANQFTAKFDGSTERTGYLGSFTESDALRLVYGAELETQSADGTFLQADRDQKGYYLEYQGGFFDQLYVTAGARYDDNDDFGKHTSYRTSAAYLIAMSGGELKFKAAYGTGFRAPSLSEIDTNLGAGGVELSEEDSEGYDLGVSWLGNSGLLLEMVYFDQTISDEIVFDNQVFDYFQASGDTESTGVEFIADWPLMETLVVSGNYTYNDTETFNGDTRFYRPKHLGNLGVRWMPLVERLTLGLNIRLSHDTIDFDGTTLDDYEVVSFNASYLIGSGIEIYGRVENLLDEDYQEANTYNTSGAAGYAGLRYTF
jgi:vitamin B12 transporter